MKLNIVPARTGILWVKLGIQTFFKQPLALTGLFFMYTAGATLLSVIPVVGVLLALGVVPAATLGLMAATQEAVKGKFPMPTVLISAFRAGRQRLQAMLVLGMLYAVACIVIVMLVPLLAGTPPNPPPATLQEASQSPYFRNAVLLVAAFYLPVSLMFWHAPALVHWHGVSPVKSLFFSSVACLRNARAMLVFGLGWTGVTFGVAMIIVLLEVSTGNPQVAAAALMPLGLMLTAMFFTSLYFTFRDSFAAPPEVEPPTNGEPT